MKFWKAVYILGCIIMLKKIRCYLTPSMAFVVICQHQSLFMMVMEIHRKILKKNVFLVWFLTLLCVWYDWTQHTNLNTFWKLRHVLLSAYLQDNQQSTVVARCNSGFRIINRGVPQGPTLGLLLFALYINDLLKVSSFETNMFANTLS